jgi:carboxypeptidase T
VTHRTTAILTLAAALVAAAPAAARAETLASPEAAPRDCAAQRFVPGARGVARAGWIAPSPGLLDIDLPGGPAGDWDLAVFRAREERAVAASTAFGSDERVTLAVAGGERLLVQACRREEAGPAAVDVGFDLFRRADFPARADERASLESVRISGPEDLARLEALGLDVTHDVTATAATVAAYSDAERARLAANGFEAETLVADLAAADEAARAREASAAARRGGSALPSGRTTYRQYADYTTEMKALAADHPEIAREVTIGDTYEGRPIQGLEIAGDVSATGDGRPAYVNLGLHHAREWPSGELPMEFAIDLVEGYGESARITSLLDEVRVFIFPVVNVDGFLASRAGGLSEYRRKNCHPLTEVEEEVPCALRSTTSGVDLNRNYGAYWGGEGSSDNPTSEVYRGAGPFSEPESQAVRQFTAGLHPTVVISNHTYTTDGKWLRQPGFDDVLFTTPDEAAMKDLGDDMGAATGWTSELGYATLGDITGATEDWNYFSQGAYGYTPEARGENFHSEYGDAVVEEYVGDSLHAGEGVREAFLIAGERAADPEHHAVLHGEAPAAATLRLRKEFQTPTCVGGCHTPSLVVPDVLDTTLDVPASGEYSWHVNPSGRPLHQSETWTMSCELPGEDPVTTQISIDRGEALTVNWDAACATDAQPPPPPTCGGEEATIIGTPGRDRGPGKLVGTAGADVIVALGGGDVVRAAGGADIVCAGGGPDAVRGQRGGDRLLGEAGRDSLVGGDGPDELRGGPGRDRCRDDGEDLLRGCARTG